jgi:2-isopropylmalate synthase
MFSIFHHQAQAKLIKETKMSNQTWSASEYTKHASFVPSMASDVFDLLSPRKGEVILDVGCGDGELTLKIQKSGCSVIGIDASPSMIKATKSRGIEAYVVDGHNIDFVNRFDAVFSNAALHWMTQPQKVINGVKNALKNGGRFVAEFGGSGNIAALIKAMRETFDENNSFGEFEIPWFFPSAEEYKGFLESSGFKVNYIELIPRPTPLKSGIEKWLEIFAEDITKNLSSDQKAVFLGSVKNKLFPVLYTEQNGWVADYVRLRFEAIKA